MGYYTVKVDPSEFEPLSEIGSRELTTWDGVKNKSLKARHITDGTIQIDKRHVTDEEFFETLTDRKDDKEDIRNERVKSLVEQLNNEDQVDAEVIGQRKASKLAMATVKSKWVALVKTENDKYLLVDAQALDMAIRLIGDSADLKVGPSEVITLWRYNVPAAAVATWDFYDVEVKE